MNTEERLLTLQWRRVSAQLRNVLWRHAEPLVGVLLEAEPERAAYDKAWPKFLDASLRDLEARRNAASPHADAAGAMQLWEVSISLMGESAILERALWSGRAMFASGGPAPAFHALAKRALAAMRWPHISDSPDKLKTWERLDRISRALAAENGDDLKTSVRCTQGHFEALLEKLRLDHRQDHNLPRTVETIAEYFWRFCAECSQPLAEGDGAAQDDAQELDAQDVMLLPGADRRLDFLERCIAVLEENLRAVIYVSLGVPDPKGRVVYLSAEAFCKAHGVSRRQFFNLKREAMRQLESCVRRKEETL